MSGCVVSHQGYTGGQHGKGGNVRVSKHLLTGAQLVLIQADVRV